MDVINLSKKSNLPICSCPSCAKKLIPVHIGFVCEGCSEIVDIELNDVISAVNLIEIDRESITKYIQTIKKEKTDHIHDETKKKLTVNYEGEIYQKLQEIKEKYKLKSLKEAVVLVNRGFAILLELMKSLSGDQFYLVDSLGNKTPEIQRVILNHAEEEFFARKAEDEVHALLVDMTNLFKAIDMKKKELMDDGTV